MKESDSILEHDKLIEKYLKLTGRKVTANIAGESRDYYAVIEQTFKRNKSRFEDNASPIGMYFNDYYVYYGPASFNIFEAESDDYLTIDGDKYYFIRKEKVKFSNKIIYYRAIIKKAQESDVNVFTA